MLTNSDRLTGLRFFAESSTQQPTFQDVFIPLPVPSPELEKFSVECFEPNIFDTIAKELTNYLAFNIIPFALSDRQVGVTEAEALCIMNLHKHREAMIIVKVRMSSANIDDRMTESQKNGGNLCYQMAYHWAKAKTQFSAKDILEFRPVSINEYGNSRAAFESMEALEKNWPKYYVVNGIKIDAGYRGLITNPEIQMQVPHERLASGAEDNSSLAPTDCLDSPMIPETLVAQFKTAYNSRLREDRTFFCGFFYLPWLRNSKIESRIDSLSLEDILIHATSAYNRSQAVCNDLGWFNEDAPSIIKNLLQQRRINQGFSS